MGEAKRRGTKEERIALALVRDDIKKSEAKRVLVKKARNHQVAPRHIGRVGLAMLVSALFTNNALELGKKYEN